MKAIITMTAGNASITWFQLIITQPIGYDGFPTKKSPVGHFGLVRGQNRTKRMELRAKPDFEEALDRMEQWWLCQNHDRPLLTVSVERPPSKLRKTYSCERDRWLDFDYRVDQAIEATETGVYLAETFPFFEPNLGPDILSTVFGLDLEFAEDTSWGKPIVSTIDEILAIEPSFDAPLWKEVERFTHMGIDAGEGRWLTLVTDLHGNADIPAALMGQEALCVAMVEDLAAVKQAIEQVTKATIQAYRRLVKPLEDAGLPIGSWLKAFSRKRSYIPQADFTGLVSTSMFEHAVLPSVIQEIKEAERSIYHLDGEAALRHLDVLLDVDEIDAIQWVYGDGHDPARRWLDVYKKILSEGKGIRVEAESADDILELHQELGNEGVWYGANFGPLTLADAQALLDAISSP